MASSPTAGMIFAKEKLALASHNATTAYDAVLSAGARNSCPHGLEY